MSDAPKRIWYSPEWDICHRTKQSYASEADITFGIEYIRKDIADRDYDKALSRIVLLEDKYLQAKKEALKPIREVVGWKPIILPDAFTVVELAILHNKLLETIKTALGEK